MNFKQVSLNFDFERNGTVPQEVYEILIDTRVTLLRGISDDENTRNKEQILSFRD